MTDRELLEMAAKAAGFTDLTEWSDEISDYDSKHYGMPALYPKGLAGQCYAWNPFEDDGDALRLAVKLGLLVNVDFNGNETECVRAGLWQKGIKHEDDPYSATRLAIVRAAAEIGKSMP